MDVFADKATAGVALQGAIARIGAHAVRTPLLRSDALDKIAGRRVWVKAECLQHSGSFKFRGAWSAISALSAEARARGIIAFSSGNHAQGVAMAAAMHGARAVIIMPEDAPLVKIAGTRALGASVVLYKRESEDREAVANTHNPDGSMCLIKPFDDVNVIAGQASVGAELADQAVAAGIIGADVFVPCGGAGLSSGIGLAMEQAGGFGQLHPCEPVGFDDVTRSLASGVIESNTRLAGSVCDAIITPSPGQITFPILRRLQDAGICGDGVVASDAQCLQAVALAVRHLRVVIEPGGAVALACALFGGGSGDVIAVASGGNIDAGVLAGAVRDYDGGL